jgi:CheY-like chemotaxis protein
MKVLYVEDNESFRELVKLAMMFRKQDEVRFAINGVEALEILKEYTPDIIITDIAMPGMDGNKLIENEGNIPVVVVTADPDTVIEKRPPIIMVYNKMNLHSFADVFEEIECKLKK